MPEYSVDISKVSRSFASELSSFSTCASFFASPPWFEFIDSLSLSDLTGGSCQLRYLTVRERGKLVAACPMLRASGPGLYFLLSIREFFFEQWTSHANRMHPDRGRIYRCCRAVTGGYRRFVERLGSRLDEGLYVLSPLSFRGGIALDGDNPNQRASALEVLLRALKREAIRHQLPLLVYGEVEANREVFSAHAFQRFFLLHDTWLDLEGLISLDNYWRLFHRTTRRAFLRERRRTDAAGVEFSHTTDVGDWADPLAVLYERTYAAYGSHLHQPAEFWRAVGREIGHRAELILAHHRGGLVGFCLLLHDELRRETWAYRIGRTNEGLEGVPFFFDLCFYEPIARSIARGCRRFWLGPASYAAKNLRGAQLQPIHGYAWSPRMSDTCLLFPYLRLFGSVSQSEIAQSVVRPAGLAQRPRTIPEEVRG